MPECDLKHHMVTPSWDRDGAFMALSLHEHRSISFPEGERKLLSIAVVLHYDMAPTAGIIAFNHHITTYITPD